MTVFDVNWKCICVDFHFDGVRMYIDIRMNELKEQAYFHSSRALSGWTPEPHIHMYICAIQTRYMNIHTFIFSFRCANKNLFISHSKMEWSEI